MPVSMVQFGQKLPVLALMECRLEPMPEENRDISVEQVNPNGQALSYSPWMTNPLNI
jgi:hypothetical protein